MEPLARQHPRGDASDCAVGIGDVGYCRPWEVKAAMSRKGRVRRKRKNKEEGFVEECGLTLCFALCENGDVLPPIRVLYWNDPGGRGKILGGGVPHPCSCIPPPSTHAHEPPHRYSISPIRTPDVRRDIIPSSLDSPFRFSRRRMRPVEGFRSGSVAAIVIYL